MRTIVQKFGGSSVADAERIRRCAQRAYDTARAGNRVVVVVSAMGKTTDGLLDLAHQLSQRPAKRELDQLLSAGEQVSIALTAIALHELGVEAVSLTGAQCGLRTDSFYTRARIESIDTNRVNGHLDSGKIVVVAGFQGINPDGDTTTLGRGGSDTSAVALAAALKSDECEIFTDVTGVYTADPRVVPDARKLDRISYEEMFELASLGAKVMAARAMFVGMKFGVPIHVRHAMLPERGTLITQETRDMEADVVTGVALKQNIGRVTITKIPRGAGFDAKLFAAIAHAGIMVDDIIQNQLADGSRNLTFTTDHGDLGDVKPVVELTIAACSSESGEKWGGTLSVDVGLARVSAVGVGMRTQSGVAARMFEALANAQGSPVNVQNITTSEIKIACIVAKEDGERAMRAVHEAFGLAKGN